jgi:predicted porin
MKKLFTASALALAASAALAQSGVTIYGIADVGVSRVSGVKGSSVKLLSSGIMDGSRLGFRGNEDLGGGYRAIFTLEHRIELDTGTSSNRPPSASQLPDRVSQATRLGLPGALQPVVTAVAGSIGNTIGVNLSNNFWDRQAFAGLVTPFGAVLAGRQYTPAYEASVAFDALGTQSALAFGQVASTPPSIDIRVSNALAYRIQLGGLTASAMAAASEGSASTGRLLGIMAIYKSGSFSVGFGHNERDNEKGNKSLTSTVVGASANVGPGAVYVQYVKIKDDNPTGLSTIAATVQPSVGGNTPTGVATAALVQNAFINGFKQDANAMHIGYRMPMGVHTFYAAWSKLDDKRPADADTTSYGLTYSYALSKRTDINAAAVRFTNSTNAQAAPGATGYLGGVTTSAGVDSTSLALGIRHRF